MSNTRVSSSRLSKNRSILVNKSNVIENLSYKSSGVNIDDKNKTYRICDDVEFPTSQIEKLMIESSDPIQINETEEIVVNKNRGIWANRTENLKWSGPIPLEKYELHNDPNPELLIKKPAQKLLYTQNINFKYLQPPQPEKPGDIIIRQLPNKQLPPAPPIIIRQEKPRPVTPPPLVIREEPPKSPVKYPPKLINISGKLLPPPARKVVLEKLSDIPPKPQAVYIERWLPYKQQKRKIIFKKAIQPELIPDPKNLIVDWQKPDVEITQEVKTSQVYCVDPKKYLKKFYREIKSYEQLPKIAKQVPVPEGLVLASDYKEESVAPIEGDLEALKLINLDECGLSEYKSYLRSKTESFNQCIEVEDGNLNNDELIEDLFRSIDCENSGFVFIEDVEKVLRGINSDNGKRISKKDLRKYLYSLDTDEDCYLNFNEFKTAFLNTTV